MAAQAAPICAVFVSNVSPAATEKTVSDFFSFCGRIKALYLRADEHESSTTQPPQCAVVVFESAAAAKTALLLTNALIIDRAVIVTLHEAGAPASPAPTPAASASASAPAAAASVVPPSPQPSIADMGAAAPAENVTHRDFGALPDEERSRTSVVASLLAAGYTLTEDVLQKAVAFDESHGFTAKAQAAIDAASAKVKAFDQEHQISYTVGNAGAVVTAKAKAVDEKYQISQTASDIGQAVELTAKAAVVKAQQNETVAGGVIRAKAAGSALSTAAHRLFEDYQRQTEVAIAERHAQKAAAAGSALIADAGDATAVAVPVEPLDVEDSSAVDHVPGASAHHVQRAGGTTNAQAPTDQVRSIAGAARGDIEAMSTKLGAQAFALYEVVSFTSQVVAGANYFLKIKTQDNDHCVHARVFRSLQGELTVHSVQIGKTVDEELAYF